MAALERLVKSATLIPKADLPTNVLEALQALPRSSETVSAAQDVTGNRESAVLLELLQTEPKKSKGRAPKRMNDTRWMKLCQLGFFDENLDAIHLWVHRQFVADGGCVWSPYKAISPHFCLFPWSLYSPHLTPQ